MSDTKPIKLTGDTVKELLAGFISCTEALLTYSFFTMLIYILGIAGVLIMRDMINPIFPVFAALLYTIAIKAASALVFVAIFCSIIGVGCITAYACVHVLAFSINALDVLAFMIRERRQHNDTPE